MKPFMDYNFLLNTDTSRILYHDAAASCPIIDYHCHISPKEICEDLRYDNITQVWLGGDHYKWRLMRCAGVPEKYITGDADAHDKFLRWAEVLGRAIGNPLYHWSHLELQRYFGYEGVLNAKTAEEVWNLCNEKLKQPEFSVRGLISRSNVETICTTDDPIDTLEWHEKLAADDSFKTAVLPAWRPDKAMNIEKSTWVDYIKQLGKTAGVWIKTFRDLKEALSKRMDYFAEHNCVLSDHALEYVINFEASDKEVEEIFAKRMAGKDIREFETLIFKTAFMLFMGRQYKKRGWTMQIHYGCVRDNNKPMFDKLGPDTGFDCVYNNASSGGLAEFLGELERTGELPRTILYSLDGNDNAAIDTICGCFQSDEIEGVSKVQHGSAWWFEDHLDGMTKQLRSLASLGYLPGFVGMLTDSRSFLSYPRHEYFRRILCRILGEQVEEGLYPNDLDTLKDIVRAISYGNAKKYFNFAAK
ncbi:MAG: glucuronate isomerase [Synergistaceae bacterium]|nr:glucuronate isomerase [Synergistaceae bacterium]